MSLLSEVCVALCQLPGVGPKSAQRMINHLLTRNRPGAKMLGELLIKAMDKIGHCQRCRNFTEEQYCKLCKNPKRKLNQLCIVGSPADLQAVEDTGVYTGLYFVLHGHLSPIDGIGPEEIGIEQLTAILAEGQTEEVVLATNPTVEGEATALYISDICRSKGVGVTRIACGVPLGGELEFVDAATIARALAQRDPVGS